MSNTLTAQEVADQLRKAIRGEIAFRLANPEWTWDRVYAGNCMFDVGDWRITIFNDCDECDYVAYAGAPDGRHARFEDWCREQPEAISFDPIDLLAHEELLRLEGMCGMAT